MGSWAGRKNIDIIWIAAPEGGEKKITNYELRIMNENKEPGTRNQKPGTFLVNLYFVISVNKGNYEL